MLAVRPKQTLSMVTRDRVRLDADVYIPDGDGPFPVLLMRQPYGRAIASTVVYAHPTWYAAHGYIVVIQDVRGRGTSEGEFRLFAHEVEDGAETVAWAANLPQSTGRVGMYGFSYQGMTQLYAAQANPSALGAIAPAMVGYHPYSDWAYENGALLLQAGAGWAIQLEAETARRHGDRAAYDALFRASRHFPAFDPIPAAPEVLTQYGPTSFWQDWLAHPHADHYWASLTPNLSHIDLPMLHIGGWFDPYLRGDLRLYREMVTRSQWPQPLRIGPWGHLPWGRCVGDRDFGPEAESPIDALQIRWFDAMLKGDGAWTEPSVEVFEMGRDRWQSFDQWPATTAQYWHLSSTGLASLRASDGRLIPADAQRAPGLDTFVHDPWRPVPAQGGHAAIPAGPCDRTAIDDRSDVLTYTTPPLITPLHILGNATVHLTCQADTASFDLCVTLSYVTPAGRAHLIAQGYGRFQQSAADWQTCTLDLQATSTEVPADHCLRISISAACYPAYALNLGTGTPDATGRWLDAQITTVSLRHGEPGTAWLRLPILEPSPHP